jgi:hypothetical protein
MSILNKVGRIQLPVERYSAGEWVDGEWVDGAITNLTVTANVQPNLTWNMTRMLIEGDRSKQAIAIYSIQPLAMAAEGIAAKKADIVLWQGVRWQVKSVMTYQMGVLNHSESVAVRVDDV